MCFYLFCLFVCVFVFKFESLFCTLKYLCLAVCSSAGKTCTLIFIGAVQTTVLNLPTRAQPTANASVKVAAITGSVTESVQYSLPGGGEADELKGTQSQGTSWPENRKWSNISHLQLDMVCQSLFIQQKYFFSSNLISTVRSRVGTLFTDEGKKNN